MRHGLTSMHTRIHKHTLLLMYKKIRKTRWWKDWKDCVRKINTATIEYKQKWQSHVLCLTKLSAKSIFLALHLTAGWSTGRQRDATAVWKYTDVAGFSVPEIYCVCVSVCVVRVCVCSNVFPCFVDGGRFLSECLCFIVLHEMLPLIKFVCLYWLCMHTRRLHVFCTCSLVCVFQELGWAYWSC